MKEVFLLTKILFKSSITSYKQKNQKKKSSILKILGWFLIYLYISAVVGFLSFELIFSLKLINQEAVFLNLCMIIILGMTTMRSLFTSINILFFSKDTEFLLPLPIKTYKIVMAKMNCLIISEYMMCLLILLPALIVYGILLKLSFGFYIIGIFVILLFPVIPIMLISLLMTIIIKFTNIIKNKDFVQYISVIISLVFIIAISFVSGTDQEVTNEEIANKLVETNGLVEMYTKHFITLKPAMKSLLNYNKIDGILNLCLLAVETTITYIIVILIMSKVYIKTVTNTVSSGSSFKLKKEIIKKYKKNSVLISYIKKEFKILFRNPIYFMQCVAPSILLPVILIISIFTGIKSNEAVEFEQFQTQFADIMITPIGIAGTIAIAIFFYMFNYISITSISRDGENAVFMKYIPISLEKQCFYKILPGIIMNVIPMIYITVILKVLLQNNISLGVLIAINIIALLFNTFNNYIMIIVDLKRPKLHWTTEYAVVKQNMNMIWEFALYILEIFVILFWGVFVQSISFFVLSVSFVMLIAVEKTRKNINKNEVQLFERIM